MCVTNGNILKKKLKIIKKQTDLQSMYFLRFKKKYL